MRRWRLQCTCLRALQQPQSRTVSGHRATFAGRPLICGFSTTTEDPYIRRRRRDPSPQYKVFDRVTRPGRDVNEWAALLDLGLPPHLQQHGNSSKDVKLDAQDIAEVLLAAQNLSTPPDIFDLLFHLGFVEGKWTTVVWLVKHLVEAFAVSQAQSNPLALTAFSSVRERPLHEITRGAIDLKECRALERNSKAPRKDQLSLKQITNGGDSELLRRKVLGMIWRSLGTMTIACADGEIKPEILEIIAYLHHMGIMSSHIYNFKPSADATVIQQPPMLNLFSSRILTSLSDAAWRGQQKLIVEEARAKGGDYAALRAEIPGKAFRVKISGLRPEIWLGLILWSTIHGGWINEGVRILHEMYSQQSDRTWKPYSWRTLLPEEQAEHQDWDKLEYMFNTQPPSTMDDQGHNLSISIKRTVSAEIINAFVDALLSTMDVGVGDRGSPPGSVLTHLIMLHNFLARSGLALAAGSWDAVVLRFFDGQETVVGQSQNFERLVKLSPAMGQELNQRTEGDLPAYVLDGSAAILGLFHRALRSFIKAGDVGRTLRLFDSLQRRVDHNKRQSLVDFLKHQRSAPHDTTIRDDGLFTSHFTGIDYPVFDTQIPPTILGPFLELVLDAKAYDFGKWLLSGDEIDGPVIPEHLYWDSALAPSMIRFASETDDSKLLSKLVNGRRIANSRPGQPTLPRNVFQSFFDSQITLRRWDLAIRVLEHIRATERIHWNVVNLAHVAQAMLVSNHSTDPKNAEKKRDWHRASELFANMVQGRYEGILDERPPAFKNDVEMLLIVLAAVHSSWAQFVLDLRPLKRHYTFTLSVKSFNVVLEGAVETYGSTTGRRLLDVFWPIAVREAQRAGVRQSFNEAGERLLLRYRPGIINNVNMQRTVVSLSAQSERNVAIYGGLQPNLRTIRIVFRKALEEFQHNVENQGTQYEDQTPLSPYSSGSTKDTPLHSNNASRRFFDPANAEVNHSPAEMVIWAVRSLRYLGMANEDIEDEMRNALSKHKMREIVTQLPSLFHIGDEEFETNPSTGNKSQ